MILTIILTALAVGSLFLLNSFRLPSRDLIYFAVVSGIYVVHSAHRLFDGIGGSVHEYALMVDACFYVLYLPLLALVFFRTTGDRMMRALSMVLLGALTVFFVFVYVLAFVRQSMSIYSYGNLIWHVTIVFIIAFAQMIWGTSAKTASRNNRESGFKIGLIRIWVVILLAPYFGKLALYLFPPDNFLIPYHGVNSAIPAQAASVFLFLLLIGRIARYRRESQRLPDRSRYRKDLAF